MFSHFFSWGRDEAPALRSFAAGWCCIILVPISRPKNAPPPLTAVVVVFCFFAALSAVYDSNRLFLCFAHQFFQKKHGHPSWAIVARQWMKKIPSRPLPIVFGFGFCPFFCICGFVAYLNSSLPFQNSRLLASIFIKCSKAGVVGSPFRSRCFPMSFMWRVSFVGQFVSVRCVLFFSTIGPLIKIVWKMKPMVCDTNLSLLLWTHGWTDQESCAPHHTCSRMLFAHHSSPLVPRAHKSYCSTFGLLSFLGVLRSQKEVPEMLVSFFLFPLFLSLSLHPVIFIPSGLCCLFGPNIWPRVCETWRSRL